MFNVHYRKMPHQATERGSIQRASVAQHARRGGGTPSVSGAGGSVHGPPTRARVLPSLRLSVDIKSILPGSNQRFQFEEMLTQDILKVLQDRRAAPLVLQVFGVRPAPGMEWLTIVDFDIFAPHADGDGGGEDDTSEQESHSQARKEDALRRLFELVRDPTSAVYNGRVTCNLDPSYSGGVDPGAEVRPASPTRLDLP